MAAINYKNFTLNSSGDDAPWSDTEVQFHKDIIDTAVKDCYSQVMDTTNGHRHYRLYDTSGTVGVRCTGSVVTIERSAAWYTTFSHDSSGNVTIQSSGGAIAFTDSSGNTSLYINAVRDYLFTLGDAAGARKFTIDDNAGVDQFTVDSDGNTYVKGDLYTTAWTSWTASAGISGLVSTVACEVQYKKIGNMIYVRFYVTGTSNAATKTFTLPAAVYNDSCPLYISAYGGVVYAALGSTTVNLYPSDTDTTWDTSGNMLVGGEFFYRTA